ncbi:MAG: hypothetical protein WKF71_15665 [Pyrinomonadaceae bacterium]
MQEVRQLVNGGSVALPGQDVGFNLLARPFFYRAPAVAVEIVE